jgi:hypothetical protein
MRRGTPVSGLERVFGQVYSKAKERHGSAREVAQAKDEVVQQLHRCHPSDGPLAFQPDGAGKLGHFIAYRPTAAGHDRVPGSREPGVTLSKTLPASRQLRLGAISLLQHYIITKHDVANSKCNITSSARSHVSCSFAMPNLRREP